MKTKKLKKNIPMNSFKMWENQEMLEKNETQNK